MPIKKSITVKFRFSASAPPPAGNVQPTDAGLAETAFHPLAERYRRRLGQFLLSAIAGFFLVLFALLLPDPLLPWFAVPGTLCIFTSLVLFFTLPGLGCPSCGKAADSGFDRFCPACGSAGLRRKWVTAAHCDACGKNMGSYKYRNYRIRFCTHCGTLLHRQGI